MRITPQVSGSSIIAIGHINPLIFRPDWLKDKEIVIGSDFQGIAIDIIHPEVVNFRLPWGFVQIDRTTFAVTAVQEPVIRACDFFVKCFQALPETPLTAVGLNREVHFPLQSEKARDHVGDVIAPKDFWGEFVKDKDSGMKVGGMRSLVMEQAIAREGRRARVDGLFGCVQVKVEPSLRNDIPHGIYVQVNDHFDLTQSGRPSDGKSAAELVLQKWDLSIKNSETLIDRIMELAK